MAINISIEKKDLWLISAVLIFLLGAGFTIAWDSGNPAIHGHTANEIEGGRVKILANNVPYTQTVNVPANTCGLIVIDANLKGKRSDGVGTSSLSMVMILNGVELASQKLLIEGTRSAGIAPEWIYGGTTSRRIYIEEINVDQAISANLVKSNYKNVEANYSVVCY